MKTKTFLSLAAIAAVLLAPSVKAVTVIPGNCFDLSSLTPGPWVRGNDNSTFEYKLDIGGGEEERVAGMADLFSPVVTSDQQVYFTWGGPLLMPIDTVVIKAGPGFVEFDTSGVDWNLYDGLCVTNAGFITNRRGNSRAISHVSFRFGQAPPPPPPSVPDGGSTFIMLGAALLGLGGVRKWICKR